MSVPAYSTVRLLRQFMRNTLFLQALLIRRRLASEGYVPPRARSVQPIPNKEPTWMTAEAAVSVIKSGREFNI